MARFALALPTNNSVNAFQSLTGLPLIVRASPFQSVIVPKDVCRVFAQMLLPLSSDLFAWHWSQSAVDVGIN